MIDPTRLLQGGSDAAAMLVAGAAFLAFATAWLGGRAAKAQARGARAASGPPSADPRLPHRNRPGRAGRRLLGAAFLFLGGFLAAHLARAQAQAPRASSPLAAPRQAADQSWRGASVPGTEAAPQGPGLRGHIEAARQRQAAPVSSESLGDWRRTLARASSRAEGPAPWKIRVRERLDSARAALEGWWEAAPEASPASAAGAHFLAALLLLGAWATWSRNAP